MVSSLVLSLQCNENNWLSIVNNHSWEYWFNAKSKKDQETIVCSMLVRVIIASGQKQQKFYKEKDAATRICSI